MKTPINHLFLLLFFLYTIPIAAQVPTVGDCLGAIPVCDPIYDESTSPVGPGNYTNELNFDNCVQNETNSVWYIFTVQSTGDFGFLLTPKVITDDYDWCLFNITGMKCEDINNHPELIASCNATGGSVCDGQTGANGDTAYDYQNFGCDENPPINQGYRPYNDLVPVQKGDTYVLLIINWSGSTNWLCS